MNRGTKQEKFPTFEFLLNVESTLTASLVYLEKGKC